MPQPTYASEKNKNDEPIDECLTDKNPSPLSRPDSLFWFHRVDREAYLYPPNQARIRCGTMSHLSGLRCRFRWSTQHLLGVYSPESGILEFFLVVGSRAARSGRAALERWRSITVFLAVILPVAATRILGLGVFVSVDSAWGRTFYLIFSHPWVSLASGLLMLAVFGWGIWKLTRRIPLLR